MPDSLQTSIRETRAIALQIRPYSRTSHIVTWLTEDAGTLATSVKGACRPKSAFLGQYDLFYTCQLLYYIREHDGIHVARECAPLDRRDALRARWREAALAAYLADLTARAVPPRQPQPGLFETLAGALDALAAGAPGLETVLRYEASLLRRLGLEPNFTLCPRCHDPVPDFLRFNLSAGSILCSHTPAPAARDTVLTLPRALIPLYKEYASEPLSGPEVNQKNTPPRNLILGLSRFLGIFVCFHLDLSPVSRQVAMGLYHTNRAQRAPEEIDPL